MATCTDFEDRSSGEKRWEEEETRLDAFPLKAQPNFDLAVL